MNVLLLTQLFQPEPAHLKGLSFAKELVRRGHHVEVLTGFPNYPSGRLYDGYRMRPWAREDMEGIRLTRVALYPSHDDRALHRLANYASLAVLATVLGPALLDLRRFDVVHVYEGPITLVLPALAFKVLGGTPYVLDVQDLWPESAESSGMLRARWGLNAVDRWCRMSYRRAAGIIVPTEGFKGALVDRGVPEAKVSVVFNWCDEDAMRQGADGARSSPVEEPDDAFTVVYAGTMGPVQALDSVIDAAELLRDRPDIRFLFVGDGVETARLRQLAASRGLDSVRFLPRQAPQEVVPILASADALLVHLKDDPLARVSIPQKTQAYMAVSRPIVMAVAGEASEVVRRAGAGVVCQPGDPTSIAEAVRGLADVAPHERDEMGRNGKKFYEERFGFSTGVGRVEAVLGAAGGRL
ncbi:MAG: glycosyltransferase family 4 protein [Acidimicrobiales bacterium]